MLRGATRIASKRIVAFDVFGMPGEPRAGGRDDALLLARQHGERGIVERVAGLDLDEHQHVAASRHDIDLTDRGFEAARDNAIAFGHEIGSGAAFRR